MSDKAAFVSSASLTQTSNVNVISPAFNTAFELLVFLILALSER